MKSSLSITVLLAALLLGVGCRRGSSPSQPEPPGVVSFAGAGLSLEPGDGWKRIETLIVPGMCPPALYYQAPAFGPSYMLRVRQLRAGWPGLQAAANELRADFDAHKHAGDAPFQEEEFAFESGAGGLHLSYDKRQMEKYGEGKLVHNHEYLLTNRVGRIVVISVVTVPQADSSAVQEMIRRSMKLQ